MTIYERVLAGAMWLEKFTIFSPQNLETNKDLRADLMQWGNYAIGYNLYPNLFNIFVKYSPTASLIVRKLCNYAFGNIPKELKNKKTVLESSFSDTLQSLIRGAGKDAFLFEGSFAIWVGYDEKTLKINEFKHILLENIRYVKRDNDKYKGSQDQYMVAIMEADQLEINKLYYPYSPKNIGKQMPEMLQSEQDRGELGYGQILFFNTATEQLYPDSVFNSMATVLLTDAGLDTLIMSFLANADILKTYIKKEGSTGADMANSAGGLLGGYNTIDGIWGNGQSAGGGYGGSTLMEYGSNYYNTGVKSAGQTEAINITSENQKIDDYVKTAGLPAFASETATIDERNARRFCMALDAPYEHFFKMESGVLNQDNQRILINELNTRLEDIRETFENILQNIVDNSVFDWKIEILPMGAGKEDVSDASDNLTGEK